MLSLQPNHQMMYHLSQLSSCLSNKTSQLAIGLKTLSTQKSEGSNETSGLLCIESLEETARNCCGELVFVNLPKISKKTHLTKKRFMNGKKVTEADESRRIVQLFSPIKSLRSKEGYQAPWEMSFVSTHSFEENKRLGFQKTVSQSVYSPVFNLQSRNFHSLLLQEYKLVHQRRGFKTVRMVEKEKEKNNGVLSQVTSIVRPAKLETKQPPNLENFADAKTVDAVATALVKVYEGGVTVGKSSERLKKIKWFLYGILAALTISVMVRTSMILKNITFNNSIKKVSPEEIEVTFADVRGSEEVKKELVTVVNFLKNPKKFEALGARLPKGVLLVGEPGVGKTLLARAVAGEARVPFFYASGSEFDEIFVGEGARRIRNLFRVAKENAPCVIFLDEIDSVGRTRTRSQIHPYANQSINQLLSEMDGFEANAGVVVLAATNAANDLDKALVRPGRFDMSIEVPTPRKGDRRDIIQYYLQKVACRNINVDVLVHMTAGWNGARLENLLNWAAILAATENAEYVNMQHILNAYDRLVLGVSWGAANSNELQKELRRTAYHEAGHTLVAMFTPGSKPIHKVTIEARGHSLGHTATLNEDELSHTKAAFKAQLDMCFGGQLAEELIFGPEETSGGCASDLEQATVIAQQMVRKLGMGATNRFVRDEERLSGEAQTAIDKDIDKILSESKERAKNILLNHMGELHKITGALLENKTLSEADLKKLLGKTDDANSSKDQ